MRSRFITLAVTALFVAGMAVPALAQAPADPPAQAPKTPPDQRAPDVAPPDNNLPPDHPLTPPPVLPEPPADVQTQRNAGAAAALTLDKLFEALKIAPSGDSAKYVENRIWARWLASG